MLFRSTVATHRASCQARSSRGRSERPSRVQLNCLRCHTTLPIGNSNTQIAQPCQYQQLDELVAMDLTDGCRVVGIAGAMFAALTQRVLPESFGLTEVIVHFGMVLVGGTGSIVGSVLGAVTLTALPEYFRRFPGMDELFFGVVIVFVLLFLPKGLVSLLSRLSSAFNERYYRE